MYKYLLHFKFSKEFEDRLNYIEKYEDIIIDRKMLFPLNITREDGESDSNFNYRKRKRENEQSRYYNKMTADYDYYKKFLFIEDYYIKTVYCDISKRLNTLGKKVESHIYDRCHPKLNMWLFEDSAKINSIYTYIAKTYPKLFYNMEYSMNSTSKPIVYYPIFERFEYYDVEDFISDKNEAGAVIKYDENRLDEILSQVNFCTYYGNNESKNSFLELYENIENKTTISIINCNEFDNSSVPDICPVLNKPCYYKSNKDEECKNNNAVSIKNNRIQDVIEDMELSNVKLINNYLTKAFLPDIYDDLTNRTPSYII